MTAKNPSLFTKYLSRYTRYPQQLPESPDPETGLIIVIPCLNEPHILDTLESILKCDKPAKPVEVLITINHSSDAPIEVKEYNQATLEEVKHWSAKHSDHQLRFYPLYYPDLRPKIAGVGSARKAGMDEAVYRFHQIGQEKGIIACLDADCSVAINYLNALEDHFDKHDTPGCSIYFEHPLEGQGRKAEYQAILDFELYLRYYKNAFYWAGFPYAYHTIGSSMASRADAYCKVGGMNKQKAGEDFYFLEKLIYQGNFTELNTTKVIPSPRKSLRVPFGTGQVVTDFIEDDVKELAVFNPCLFEGLRSFIHRIPELFELPRENLPDFLATLPHPVNGFLQQYDFPYYLEECQEHSSTEPIFLKRFFHWFNAFLGLKYLHYGRDHHHANVPVSKAVQWLFEKWDIPPSFDDKKAMLEKLREIDRGLTGKPNPRIPF